MSNETFCLIYFQEDHNMIDAECANVRMPKAVLHIPGRSHYSWGVCAYGVNQQSLSRATVIHFPKCSLIFTFTQFSQMIKPFTSDSFTIATKKLESGFIVNINTLTKFILQSTLVYPTYSVPTLGPSDYESVGITGLS